MSFKLKNLILPLIFILLLTFTLIGNCWVAGYNQRVKLTIDHTKIDSALSDFPVTVFFTAAQCEEIFAEFDADEDFDRGQFALGNDTLLKAEKELFDDSESKAIYHVKIPSVSSSAGTDYYFYYDNDHAHNTSYIGIIGSATAAEVWVDYTAVYHMVDATTSTVLDSTSNSNDGTKKAANEPIEAMGKVHKGQDFDGTDDHIQCGTDSSLDVTTTLTISACVSSDTAQLSMIAGKLAAASSIYDDWNYCFRIAADNTAILIVGNTTANTWDYAVSTGALLAQDGFYHIAVTWDGSNACFYSNGALDSNPALSFTAMASTGEFIMGKENITPQWELDGDIDELHFSNSVACSAAWIKATYNSLWDSLLTYGSEETSGVTYNAVMFGTNF